MSSKLGDSDLARRYLATRSTVDELETIVDYIYSVRDVISERTKAARLKGSGYKWVREYEALNAAGYVCRLLLERQKGLLRADKHDLFSRGYETNAHIERVARE